MPDEALPCQFRVRNRFVDKSLPSCLRHCRPTTPFRRHSGAMRQHRTRNPFLQTFLFSEHFLRLDGFRARALRSRPGMTSWRHCEELATKLQGNFALKRRSNPESLQGDDWIASLTLAMTHSMDTRLEGYPAATIPSVVIPGRCASIEPGIHFSRHSCSPGIPILQAFLRPDGFRARPLRKIARYFVARAPRNDGSTHLRIPAA